MAKTLKQKQKGSYGKRRKGKPHLPSDFNGTPEDGLKYLNDRWGDKYDFAYVEMESRIGGCGEPCDITCIHFGYCPFAMFVD